MTEENIKVFFLHISDIDVLVEAFNSDVSSLLDLHAPLRTLQPRSSSPSWFNHEVAKALVDGDLAYSEWRRQRNDLSFQRFKILRNRGGQAIRLAKRRCFSVV